MEYNYRYPYFAILILGIGIGIYRHPNLSKSTRIILYLSVITLLTEVIAYWQGLSRIPNLVIYNSFMLIQTALLGLAFTFETSNRQIKVGTLFTIIIVSVFWFVSIDKFNSNGLVAVLTFIVAISLFYFYLLIKTDTVVPLRNFPFFWFSTGFLIFGVLNVVGFGLIYLLDVESQILNSVFSSIRIYSNYFLYALFIPAFLLPQNSVKNA